MTSVASSRVLCLEDQIRMLQSSVLEAFVSIEENGRFSAMDVEEFRTELELDEHFIDMSEAVVDEVYQATVVLASKRIGLAFHDLARSASSVEAETLVKHVTRALNGSVVLEIREIERLATDG